MAFAQGLFAIDPNSTPEQVAQKRAMIAALMPRFGSAKYVGEGLGQAATGFAIGRQNRKLDKVEGAGTKGAGDLMSRIFGTANSAGSQDVTGPLSVLGVAPDQGGSASAGAYAPTAPMDSADALAGDAMAALGKGPTGVIEAGAGYTVIAGPDGKPQRREGTRAWRNNNPGNIEYGDFAKSMGAIGTDGRFAVFPSYEAGRKAKESLLFEGKGYRGKTIAGAIARYAPDFENDTNAYTNAIAGALGVPADTPLSALSPDQRMTMLDAMQRVEGFKPGTVDGSYAPAPATSAAAPAAPSAPQIPVAELYAALSNPWLSADQRGLVTSLIEQQQSASDPVNQIELQKAQLELQQMQNPQQQPPADYTERMFLAREAGLEPGTPEFQSYLLTGSLPASPDANQPAGFVAMDLQAKAAGLEPGTPEYQEFMRNGGTAGAPAAYIALKMQAEGAGLKEGTPEFQQFMLTRGAGSIAEAKAIGEASGAATAAAPSDIVVADRTLQYIDEVRNHPGRGAGTGATSVFNVIPGTSGRDFQNRVDQLKSGAFLTAIDDMRGMGSLSNAEGQTATAAITRMDTATSEEEFNAALADYEAIVKLGRDRAQKRIKAPSEQPPASPAPATGGPQPGMTEDGYQFQGGDPADPANWVKVQ